jgi:hypothetical protein
MYCYLCLVLAVQDPVQSEPNPCRNQEVRGLMNITTPQVGHTHTHTADSTV